MIQFDFVIKLSRSCAGKGNGSWKKDYILKLKILRNKNF